MKDILATFDKDVIRKEYPDTPEGQRLLKPLMILHLSRERPIDDQEFREVIPEYLRSSISPKEAKFLPSVFEMINEYQDKKKKK